MNHAGTPYAYKILDRTNVLVTTCDLLRSQFPNVTDDLEWFAPTIMDCGNVAVSYNDNGKILSLLGFQQLPPPDKDWIEIHVSSIRTEGLSSIAFNSLLDLINWLPTFTKSKGVTADIALQKTQIASMLYKLGFRVISVAGVFPDTHAVFARKSSQHIPLVKIPTPKFLKTSFSKTSQDNSSSRVAKTHLSLTKEEAEWWKEYSDATAWLGASSPLSSDQIAKASISKSSHTFISQSFNSKPAWSLCKRNNTHHSQCYLLISEVQTMRRNNLINALQHTVLREVSCECVVRMPVEFSLASTAIALSGLIIIGRTPDKNAMLLMKTQASAAD